MKRVRFLNQFIQGVTHQKYDKSLEDNMTMYDNQPYKRDYELCNTNNVRLVSGNVMKYYTFQYNRETPYLVNTQDEKTEKMLAAMKVEAEAVATKV